MKTRPKITFVIILPLAVCLRVFIHADMVFRAERIVKVYPEFVGGGGCVIVEVSVVVRPSGN